MESVVGIFRSSEDARRAAEAQARAGVPRDRLSVLTPGSSEVEIHSRIPTTEAEPPGVGKALGGVVGGVFGATTGMGLGALAASLLVPGFGALAAAEMLGAVLLGAGGVAAGAAAGDKLDEKISRGLPKDELYLYEHALHSGHSIVFALVADEEEAERVRTALAAEGAESLDAARESWWVGIRETERADYERSGGDFAAAEPAYRQGFEAAMRPKFRGQSFEEAAEDLRDLYPEYFGLDDFKRGYERGLRHLRGN
ncbi:MAG TPA: hypothetical protein VGS98_09700 [Thermoanaerobaculia bacterium]|nr:hypothetical protein [Thermoanaerobaculia bacterium]